MSNLGFFFGAGGGSAGTPVVGRGTAASLAESDVRLVEVESSSVISLTKLVMCYESYASVHLKCLILIYTESTLEIPKKSQNLAC